MEVGSFPANAFGLYDMHGNVEELCRDWHGAYPLGRVTDPTGARTGTYRVARGGGWSGYAHWCRSAFRFGIEPGIRDDILGFRVALSSVVEGGGIRKSEGMPDSNPVRQTSPESSGIADETRTVSLANDIKLDLVRVAAGKFMMGSSDDEPGRDKDETRHEVTISKPYWMGKHEVTQAQWEAVMRNNPSRFKGEKLPVEAVSWEEAMAFCKKLTERERVAGRLPEGYCYTLPTEAEWEYACRAGTATPFNTGNNFTTGQGNYDGNYPYNPYDGNAKGEYRRRTTEVGSFPANAFGLYDMHGNVEEWCRDWYGDYPTGSVTDPTGARTGSERIIRGGDWFRYARQCRSANRSNDKPANRRSYRGFRVALSSRIADETRTVSLANDIKLDLVRVAAGKFMMGSSDDEPGRYKDETQHEVIISKPYWMGKHEVTQAQWEAVMGNNPSQFKGAKLPVENVTCDEAMAFCKKLTEQERAAGRLPEGYRYTLPTEAEWEYACRAGTTTPFSTGNNLTTEQGNYDGNGTYNGNAKGEYRERTTEVGSFPANAFGLYDMHGNVEEWCWDWYGDYPKGNVTDPTGARTGSNRVSRGGSWSSYAHWCRSAYRSVITPGARENYRGFRVALSSVVGEGD
jgi:formylglycine-generating enzyme required for sulfatase activity